MFKRQTSLALIASFVLLLGFASASTALATYSDRLSGLNTVDITAPYLIDHGQIINFSAEADGNGVNKLTVKVQQETGGGTWLNLETIKVTVGTTGFGAALVQDLKAGQERIRYRLSRKLGTKAIDWTFND